MARKTIDVTIDAEGRDKGKVFCIREMPASRAEKWALQALLIVGRSGVDIGNAVGMGMQGIFYLGITSLLRMHFEEAEPLLDEMMECVQIKPDEHDRNVVRQLIEDDIEEVQTRVYLRQKVLELHTGFSLADAPWKSTSGTSAKT